MAINLTTTYAHPYIGIEIFDNTEYTEDAVIEERKEFNGMQVGFFAGGRDNELLYMSGQKTYLDECGNPDYKKYGQAAYNVDNVLSTGNAGMYIMNLRPDTATHANIVVMVRFKIVTTDPATNTSSSPDESTPVGEESVTIVEEAPGEASSKLVYSFYAKTIETAKTEEELLTGALNLMEVDVDSEGYYNMPLATFYAIGRGEYGNGIHLVFSNATEYVTEEEFYDVSRPNYHMYTVTVAQQTSLGLEPKELNYGNFDEDGFDAFFSYGVGTFLGDNINDIEQGSAKIRSEVYSATIDTICKLYNTTFSPEVEVTASSLDLLTGLTLDGTPDENLQLDTSASDFLNLFSLDGFALQSGSDGWDGMSSDEIIAAKEELLIKAYAGDIDPMIRSRFSSPCNFNLDANYNTTVKRQMAALANRRKYDLMTYLDLGTTTTTTGMISMLSSLKNIYGFNIVKEGHSYKWRDKEYTGKICNMTITHWLGKALANHMYDRGVGFSQPLAKDYAILRSTVDYIAGTFKPVIDPDANDVKNQIYKLRGNCYETLTYNSVQRSTAITSCQTKSDRLLEMNEYILQDVVKTTYDVLASKVYKLGEADDRARYEEEASDILENRLSKYVRSISVSLEMTAADEKKSLLRIKVRIVFKTVIQNGAVEIYLDPRVTNEDTTTTVSTETDIEFDE